MRTARATALAVAISTMLVAGGAHAAEPTAADKAHAKEAYDRGVEAHARGDMKKAAEEFARADALAPSPVALQAALDAAVEADDPALGAELVERSKRAPASGALSGSVDAARSKFAGRAGKIRVTCPPAKKCLAKVDEKFVEIDRPVWAQTGRHTVLIQAEGSAQTKLVEVRADEIVDVSPDEVTPGEPARPAPPPIPEQPPQQPSVRSDTAPPQKNVAVDLRSGLPPVVFYAGVGITVLAGAATAYSALKTQSKHDSFGDAGCEAANYPDCEDLKKTGERWELYTNVLLAGTAVAAVATVVVGISFTDWKGPSVAPVRGGAVAGWGARF